MGNRYIHLFPCPQIISDSRRKCLVHIYDITDFPAVALGNIAKIIPITPGAIGTYEVALTAVFGLGGIKPEIGFTVAVLDHIIKKIQLL